MAEMSFCTFSFTTYFIYILKKEQFKAIYYGLSVISVTVTKKGHSRGGGLYGTSKTIKRGVAELYRKFSI